MNVRQIRQAIGITQEELSLKYKIPLKTLQNWESAPNLSSARNCPNYVVFLLKKAVQVDFPNSERIINADIDENHLIAIKQAKSKIRKSSLFAFTKDVILYGSTARGQAKPTSDVDILLVLDENVKTKKNYNKWITYLKGNISSDNYNIPEVDLHIAFGNSWKENGTAYFMNIRQEGFSIWN